MSDDVSALIAALAALSGVALGAVLQHFFTRTLEEKRQQRDLRTAAYLDLLRGMTELTYARRSGDEAREAEALRLLTDAKLRVAIDGSPLVAQALARFVREGENLAMSRAREAFTSLLATMRADATGRKEDLTAAEVALILIGPTEEELQTRIGITDRPRLPGEQGDDMPFTLVEWASLAAIVSAMSDVLTIGAQTFDFFFRRRLADPALPQKAEVLRDAYSTYSDREVEAIKKRIEACRDRFIKEGTGEGRKTCLCSVLQDVKDGNGGTIPVDEWQKAYDKLGCAA